MAAGQCQDADLKFLIEIVNFKLFVRFGDSSPAEAAHLQPLGLLLPTSAQALVELHQG